MLDAWCVMGTRQTMLTRPDNRQSHAVTREPKVMVSGGMVFSILLKIFDRNSQVRFHKHTP
jgi:hypothetical protein